MSHQTERDLLGALLGNPDLLGEADRLRAEDFGLRAHGFTFDAMRAVQASGAVLDHRTLRLELERAGNLAAVGGAAFVGELITGFARLESVARFVDVIAAESLRRQAVRACSELGASLADDEATTSAALSEGIAKLSRIAEGGTESTSCEGAGLLRACTQAVESLLSGEGAGRGRNLSRKVGARGTDCLARREGRRARDVRLPRDEPRANSPALRGA